jgi:flagellar biosynthesis/type III secretory pathway M-ring protein FliF/YscJ
MLGTGVMRNLYTAYDLENNILSIALTDFEATNRTKNIIAIPKAGVAAITKEAFEGKPNITDNVVSNTTTNPDSSKPPNSSSTGVQGAEKGTNSVAIGVGVAVPVVVIIVLVVGFLLFRRRKQKKEEAARTAAEQYNKPELEDNSKVMGTQAGLERTVNGEVDGNPVHEMHDVSGVVHEMPANVPRQELA